MTEGSTIIRIAARGDGVTADGRHVAGGVTGDRLGEDGALIEGPHHVTPPCKHFAACGACQLQHADDEALRQFVRDRVVLAAEGQGIEAQHVAPAHISPPRSRRRATLHFQRAGGRIVAGFRQERSHKIVDLTECHVLVPSLFEILAPVRKLLAGWNQARSGQIGLTLVDQGVDMSLGGAAPDGLEQTEGLLDFARHHRLARLSVDHGYGAEPVWEPEPATVTLSGMAVPFPSGAFLQATDDGEAALAAAVKDWSEGSEQVADLFAGLGTFAFAMAGHSDVLAVEAAKSAVLAATGPGRRASRPVQFSHRDLFRNPLDAQECSAFGAIVLDPPRAGAREQVAQIAASDAVRVIYVSCNPASWAKDARMLANAGFKLQEVRPVGQFRWSTHVELASLFVR